MFGAALLLALSSPVVRAQYRHRVVLLEPPVAESTVEVRARLRGELSAAGFDVITLPVSEIDDPKRASETAARELQPAAVLFVVDPPSLSDQVHQASIWVSDRLLRRTFVLTYSVDPADPGRDLARVAVQVAEILKADLAELSVTRAEPVKPPVEPEPEPELPPLPPPPPPRQGDGPRVEGGVALLQGFDGFKSALTPIVRLGASLPSSWFRRAPFSLDLLLTGVAFGTLARAEYAGSSAAVRQSLGTLSVAARLGPTHAVQPTVSVSSGAYRAAWAGDASAPLTGRAGRSWSGVSGAGAGVSVHPTSGLSLAAGAEVLAAWSRTVVRFQGAPAASLGVPMVLVSATAAGVF
jgi:hypothetical protein